MTSISSEWNSTAELRDNLLKKVLNHPSAVEENLFNLINWRLNVPHRYVQDSLDRSNHPRWVYTLTLRLYLLT